MAVTTESASAAPTSQEALHSLLCKILPPQGAWSDDAYLWLTDHSNRLIEFTDGHVQELPMPTFTHQAVLLIPLRPVPRLPQAARRRRNGGRAAHAHPRRQVREPDLCCSASTDPRCEDRYWLGADLVAEVIARTTRGGTWWRNVRECGVRLTRCRSVSGRLALA